MDPFNFLLQESDVISFDSGFPRLLEANIVSDDQLNDYGTMQAFRGIAHAVKRKTLVSTLSSHGQGRGHKVFGTGSEVVLYRMATACLQGYRECATSSYLSVRLLCDEKSNYGEGNDRPCCTEEWIAALLEAPRRFVRRGETVELNTEGANGQQYSFYNDRYFQLGYLLITSETIRAVSQKPVKGKSLARDFPHLVAGWLKGVLPDLGQLVEEYSKESTGTSPTRIEVELNNCVLHSIHWISHAFITEYSKTNRKEGQGRLVFDRDQLHNLWWVLGVLKRAIKRSVQWIEEEIQSDQQAVSRVSRAKVWDCLEAFFNEMEKKYSDLRGVQQNIKITVGTSAKDYHVVSDALWGQSLRMTAFVRDFTEVWIRCHGGLFTDLSRFACSSDEELISFIGSHLSQVPLLEKPETESDVFVALSTLLCSSFTVFYAAPSTPMQSVMWGSSPALTGQIHSVVVQRCLQFKHPKVLQLSSFLSSSILLNEEREVGNPGLLLSSSQELLRLLEKERDAASMCAIPMLILAVASNPHSMIPSVFRMLSEGGDSRLNALDVLAALPDIGKEHPKEEEKEGNNTLGSLDVARIEPERMRELMRILAENLLLHLNDEELVHRLSGSRLFSKVKPEDVVQPLLHMYAKKDASGKRQSSVKNALSALLLSHADDGKFLLYFLNCAYECTHTTEDTVKSAEVPSKPRLITPADVYTHSVLYSQSTEEEGENNGTQKGSLKNRVSFLVSQLLGEWGVQISLKVLSPSVLEPVYTYTESLATDSFQKQEWFVKFLTGIVTQLCSSGKQNTTMCVERITKNLSVSSSPEKKEEEVVWLESIKTMKEDSMADSYQVLLPLLCLRACPRTVYPPTDIENLDPIMESVFHTLTTAFLREPYRSRLTAKIDLQRILLEVIGRFSFPQVVESFEDVARKDSSACLLIDRALLFKISTEVTVLLDRNWEEGPVITAETSALLCRCFTEILSFVLDVFITGSSSRYAHGSPNAQEDIPKLVVAACDGLAALSLYALVKDADAAIKQMVYTAVYQPLEALQQTLRSGDALPESELVQRCSFSVQSQTRAVYILEFHQKGAVLLPLWFSRYLPFAIDTSNAICARVKSEADSASLSSLTNLAVQCCEVLFNAVMTSSKIEKKYSIASPLLSTSSEVAQSLVSFSIGTARYTKLPLLQGVGVRLLSSLLGAAPELLVGSEGEGDTYRAALGALQSVSNIHPSADTRRLAESVLQALTDISLK